MQLEKTLEISGHSGAIYTLVRDKHWIYSGSADRFVARWNTQTGVQDKFTIRCDDAVYQLEIIPEKQILIIGTSSGSIHLIDLEKKQEIKHLKAHHSALFALKFDPLTNRLYAGDSEGNLSVWDCDDWKSLLFLPFDCGKIRKIHLLKEKYLLLCAQDGSIRCIESKAYNELWKVEAHKDGCFALASTEDRLISVGKDALLKTWELLDMNSPPRLQLSLPAHHYGIYEIILDPEVQLLFTASRDKSIKVWSWPELKVLQKIERKQGGHNYSVNTLIRLESRKFASASDDKRIICWQLRT